MTIVERIMETLERDGSAMYGGEAVTQLQHALQCATLARAGGHGPHLVTAALLHDYGHLINEDDSTAAAIGIDQEHEDVAADYLAAWFPEAVTEPVRMHVPAKRYLCAVDPDYFATLSPASVQSLEVQGGIFTPTEAEAFIARPHAKQAVLLRRWDDLAKDPQAETLPLAEFRGDIELALIPAS
jgi:phosphonate degradation associated HDIG domain protein